MNISFRAVIAALLCLALRAQFPAPGSGGGGGGGGVGAANATATSAPAVTSLAVNIASLNLSSVSTVLVQCWSGTAAPYSPVTVTSLDPASTSSVTANFTSTANVTCRANSSGGAGPTGPGGATGPTGAAGEVTSADSSATDSQLVVMSGTTGKAIKKSALSGVLKAASGVPAAVTGTATDCVLVDGTSGPCGSGGGVTFVPARTTSQIITLPAIDETTGVGNHRCPGVAAGETFTRTSGSGNLWVGRDKDCALTVRHNLVGTCSADCTAVGSSSGFDPSDLPLYEWTITGTDLDLTGTSAIIPYRSIVNEPDANMTRICVSGVCTWAATGFDPLDRTSDTLTEEFRAPDGGTGSLGWAPFDSPTLQVQASELNHPGILRIAVFGSGSGSISLIASGPVNYEVDPFSDTKTRMWLFRPNTTGGAVNVGLYTSTAYTDYIMASMTADGVGLSFMFCSASCGGGASSIASGVSVAAGDWVTVRFRSVVAGTILASAAINGGAFSVEKSLCASGCDASGTLPSVAMSPFFFTYHASNPTTLDLDYYKSYQTGMTR
jgi:hypothetical protein